MKMFPAHFKSVVENTAARLNQKKITERIWGKDHTVWKDDPTEISNRLGWLDCIDVTKKSFGEINSFVEEIRSEGFTHALLMGMGGSSLAPEVFRKIFGVKKGYLDLHVLDSTHPEAVIEYEKKFDPVKTLYIVSTKSGGTIETMSLMKYFFTAVSNELGKENASKRFVAITDPGSGLENIAKKLNFRKIFLNDPDIGGRFSALSLFGIVPAALVGIDIESLFVETSKMIIEFKHSEALKNSGAKLGGVIGSLANEGIDKLTFILSPKLKYLGGWLEQLIAESTGKDGKGILPVDLETPVSIDKYGKDRIFAYIKITGDNFFDDIINVIKSAGFPLIEIELENIYQLGAEFFRWEFATAVAGHVMGVQPFDQPNVESAKVAARAMMEQYSRDGFLPSPEPALVENEIRVFGNLKSDNLKDVLNEFLSSSKDGRSYVALQAYLKPENETWDALQRLRCKILSDFKVATTLGYGPRFLHSTGQLHKGDGGNGYFIQFIDESFNDVPIPEIAGEEKSSISFATLIKAQALGDRQALLDNKRRVLCINIGLNVTRNLNSLIEYL